MSTTADPVTATVEPNDAEYKDCVKRIELHPAYATRPTREVRTDALAYRWVQPYYSLRQTKGHEDAIREVENRICAAASLPPMWETPDPLPIALPPLTVRDGRLWDGQRWVMWRGVSEFSAIHLCRTGQTAELVRRLDRAQVGGANGIRVLMMAKNLFDLNPAQGEFWTAVDKALTVASSFSLYVELVVFADAQMVMPGYANRVAFASQVVSFVRKGYKNVILQVANEPYKNGWQSATDPQLLELAAILATAGLPFSVGDPPDYVADPSVSSEPLRGELDTLAQRSNVLVLHGERKAQDARWAGWVDHLKGFLEAYDNPYKRYLIHDEPMGAASTYQNGRRDNRSDAHKAAALVCAVMGVGFTYHYISEQDDATPGIDGLGLAALVPQSPDYQFKNAGTGGCCVKSFEGWDKIRTTDNGTEGWAVAYGHVEPMKRITWSEGWRPVAVLKISPSVELYRATKG